MKIAIVLEAVFPEDKGGLERWYFSLARYFAAAGHEVEYLNNSQVNGERGGVGYRTVTNWRWSYLPGGVRSIRQSIKFTWALTKWMKTNRYDAIYLSSVPIISIFTIPFIRLTAPRTTIIVEWLEFWPIRYWIAYKGFLLGLIGWTVQLFAAQLGNIKTTFVPRIYKPLNLTTVPWVGSRTVLLSGLCSSSAETMATAQARRNDILFIGRLVDEKQPILALEAVKRYMELGWAGKFWLIGTGPSEPAIRSYIAEHFLTDSAMLIANASDEIVKEKMDSSFVLLHPSKREGYGLVVVEAAARGLPALLIDYPDNGAIDLNVTPELVADPGEIDSILGKLHFADSNFERLSKEAKSWAENASHTRTMETSAEEILKLFRSSRVV